MTYNKRKTVIYMFIAILVNMCAHAGRGLLIVKPQDTYVLAGQLATLNCSTSSTEDVHWYYGIGLSYVYAGRKLYQPFNNRLQIEVYQNDGNTSFNLVFPSAKPEDAGMYTCRDNQGRGETSSAEMTVFTTDENGTCHSNMKPDGVVIPNDCNIDPDEVQLSCSVTFYGNNPPQLEWKKVSAVVNGASDANTECRSINNRFICNTSIIGDRQMNSSSYVCQTTGSSHLNISLCAIEVKNLIYAFSGKTTSKSFVGNEVLCNLDTSQSCYYKWKHSDIVVSTNRTITPDKTGLYQCEAECNIRGKRCIVFDYAYISQDDSTSCSTGCVVAICVIILLLVIIAILTVIYCFFLSKEKGKNRQLSKEGDSKPKKRSKQNLLAEQSNEIHLLRNEIEIKRTEKESLSEQFRISVDKAAQVNMPLTEELSIVKANYDAHMARLKQELDKNKIASYALQTKNDKLKQELDAEKTTNNSLRNRNDEEKANYVAHIEQLKQELEDNKRASNEIQTKNDKLKRELDAEKTNNISPQTSKGKYVEELDMYKATVKTLETEAEKLRRELQDTKVELRYKSIPVLVQTFTTKAAEEKKKSIRGLTILDKELFVVSGWSSEIEVYDSVKLSFSRRWTLRELTDPVDIGSCNRNKCLYISDYKFYSLSKEILRIDPTSKLIKKWSTRDDYGRLSVTDESNVILTVDNKNKLNEYSPDGQLIREINLSSDAGISHPWHAIKLTNGLFVVSHGVFRDYLDRVCMVGIDGKLVRSFGGKRGSTIGQLNEPVYLSVDRNGFVVVSDRVNCRVLLLDSDLEFKREILSKEKHGLHDPCRILLDESNGRLFVADNDSNNERILIFEFK